MLDAGSTVIDPNNLFQKNINDLNFVSTIQHPVSSIQYHLSHCFIIQLILSNSATLQACEIAPLAECGGSPS